VIGSHLQSLIAGSVNAVVYLRLVPCAKGLVACSCVGGIACDKAVAVPSLTWMDVRMAATS
jgi:hypothetical protein